MCDSPKYVGDGLAIVQWLPEVDHHLGPCERSSGRRYQRLQPVRLFFEIVPAEKEVSCDRFAMVHVRVR
jgi:hypothetical protein